MRIVKLLTSSTFWVGVFVPILVAFIGFIIVLYDKESPAVLALERVKLNDGYILRNSSENSKWSLVELSDDQYQQCGNKFRHLYEKTTDVEFGDIYFTNSANSLFDGNKKVTFTMEATIRNVGDLKATIYMVNAYGPILPQPESQLPPLVPEISLNSPLFIYPSKRDVSSYNPIPYILKDSVLTLYVPMQVADNFDITTEEICFQANVLYKDGENEDYQQLSLGKFALGWKF
jgi:hypothetical protein